MHVTGRTRIWTCSFNLERPTRRLNAADTAHHDDQVTDSHYGARFGREVPTYWQKMRAEDDARRVYGLRSVANYLVVAVLSLYYRDDDDIAVPRDLRLRGTAICRIRSASPWTMVG
jgi:hypothetical protein